jgi:hypothetical protein
MQVEDEGQQKPLGRFPPQLSYELGQESELRGTSSKVPKAWLVRKDVMRVKRSRANGRPATTPTVILVMTVEAVIAICLPRREKFKMSINKILRVAPAGSAKIEVTNRRNVGGREKIRQTRALTG